MRTNFFNKTQHYASSLLLPMALFSLIACSATPTATTGTIAKKTGAQEDQDQELEQDESKPTKASTLPRSQDLQPKDQATSTPQRDLSLAKVPTDSEASDLISKDFASNSQSADVIYVDIRHLAQQSTGTNDLEAYRFGIAKALNSLSVAPTIVKLSAIDTGETIFRVKLSDYTLMSGWPVILRDKKARDNTSTIAGATVVKGDWLVFAATRPEAYNTIMRIPGWVKDLETEIRADYSKAVYINAPATNVTFYGRVLQRIPIDVGGKPGGYYWRTYDPVGKIAETYGFNNPASVRFATLPAEWAGEYFYSLPNGLQGYSLSGFIFQTRLDAQLFAATDYRRPQDGLTKCAANEKNCGYVLNGESCMTCHAGGINPPGKVLGFKGVGTQKEAEDLFFKDRERFLTAVKELGYPDYNGTEPILETITAFKKRTSNVDKRVQAGELEGVSNYSGMFTRK